MLGQGAAHSSKSALQRPKRLSSNSDTATASSDVIMPDSLAAGAVWLKSFERVVGPAPVRLGPAESPAESFVGVDDGNAGGGAGNLDVADQYATVQLHISYHGSV